jgi:hypothetical protein
MDATSTEQHKTGDAIADRDYLAGRIVEQLRRQGYYLVHLSAHEGQALIDLQWAALVAGRTLGHKTRTYSSKVGKRIPGMITVVVAPTRADSHMVPLRPDRSRALLDEMLAIDYALDAVRRPA